MRSFARMARPSRPALLPATRGEGGRRPGGGLQRTIGNRAVRRLLRRPILQRAETDDRSCAGLKDIETDVDAEVNRQMKAARRAAGKPMDVPAFLAEVNARLGAGAVSPIERFIDKLPASKRTTVPSSLSGTKYAGVEAVNTLYGMQRFSHVVGAAAKVHSLCIGADKLGHFFNEGFQYFELASAGSTVDETEGAGRMFEILIQGLGTTGVFSNADLAANRQGLKFYQDLAATPSMTFAIADYIAPDWNEQVNPSFYGSAEANVVWANLLTGAWKGTFTGGGAKGAVPLDIALTATTGGAVTGSYEYPLTSGGKRMGTITGGTITTCVHW